jgi:hypothetical protein
MAGESVSDSGPVDIESHAKQPVAATEGLSSQRIYHGTRADLMPGDLIDPGYASHAHGRSHLNDRFSVAAMPGWVGGGRSGKIVL